MRRAQLPTVADEHHFIYINPDDLAQIRRALGGDNGRLHYALDNLRKEAESALGRSVITVVDKTGIAASGNKQDFFAIGAYSWPNPATADGMPYIRRDGLANPEAYESSKYDKRAFHLMVDDVKLLALAYYYTGERAYALKASEWLRAWFVNETTQMNPNLRHAAVRPGVNDGLHSGIIEGVVLIEMLDYVALLDSSDVLPIVDREALKRWFLRFCDWLVDSSFGRREVHSSNNHGAYYLTQVVAFAGYGGNHRRASSAFSLAKSQMAAQFALDGSMPKEIGRPNSFFYSVYGLRAFVVLARLGERYGEDLWRFVPSRHTSPPIAKSFHALAPYLTGREEWRGPRQDEGFSPYALQIGRMAGRAYRAKIFDEIVEFLSRDSTASGPMDPLIGHTYVPVVAEMDHQFRRLTEGNSTRAQRRVLRMPARLGSLLRRLLAIAYPPIR